MKAALPLWIPRVKERFSITAKLKRQLLSISQATIDRRLTLKAFEDIKEQLPFPLKGIDSDNGREFINYHLKAFCDRYKIQFTRGRPYKKDDNAHIEQKNSDNMSEEYSDTSDTIQKKSLS